MKLLNFGFCALLPLVMLSCVIESAEMPDFGPSDHASLFYINNQSGHELYIDSWYEHNDSSMRTSHPIEDGKSDLICQYVDANAGVPDLIYPNWDAHCIGNKLGEYVLLQTQIRRNINEHQYVRYLPDVDSPSGFLLAENYEQRPDYSCSYDLWVVKQYKEQLPASQVHHYIFTIDEAYLQTLPMDTVDIQ